MNAPNRVVTGVYLQKSACLCIIVKRGLLIWQKRPIYMAKEAYLHGKRGLFPSAYLTPTCDSLQRRRRLLCVALESVMSESFTLPLRLIDKKKVRTRSVQM